MEKNKIALVSYSLSQGGLERVAANSTFLFQKMGYEVHIYVLESKIDYPFVGILLLTLPPAPPPPRLALPPGSVAPVNTPPPPPPA